MLKKLRKSAIASFICALSFMIGLCLILIIAPEFNDGPEQRFATLSNFSGVMQFWYFLVYVVFGASMLVLSTSLVNVRQKEHGALEQVTILASYLWSAYIFASGLIAILSIEFLFGNYFQLDTNILGMWREIYDIQMGLGEGAEWVGAVWVVLINSCLLKNNLLSKQLARFGFFISVFGFCTLIPELKSLGAIFGLLQVLWFILVGVFLLRATKEDSLQDLVES